MKFTLETEIRYNDALQDIIEKEKKYTHLYGKLKSKELDYENKIQEINLNIEQDKYINELINEPKSKLKK